MTKPFPKDFSPYGALYLELLEMGANRM